MKNLNSGSVITVMFVFIVVSFILYPVFATAPANRRPRNIFSAPKQIGTSIQIYISNFDEKYPDRRDLKRTYEYAPWQGFPLTDPRTGWLVELTRPYHKNDSLYSLYPLMDIRIRQGTSNYWMWGFDKVSDSVSRDNFWGKRPGEILKDLEKTENEQFNRPKSIAEIELLTTPHSLSKFTPRLELSDEVAKMFEYRTVVYLDSHVKRAKNNE